MTHALGREVKYAGDTPLTWKKHKEVYAGIIEALAERERIGLERYSNSVVTADLTVIEWLRMAREELLDGLVYIQMAEQVIQLTGVGGLKLVNLLDDPDRD